MRLRTIISLLAAALGVGALSQATDILRVARRTTPPAAERAWRQG
jgi:hypothetical protein